MARITPERRDDILEAALRLLRERGVAGVTTTALAREARCSKETLYLLFENRDAILAALIDRQATALNAALQQNDPSQPAMEALALVGAQLLRLLTSEGSLAINRAALSDPTGRLSHILIKRGKERLAPKIISLIERLHHEGTISVADMSDAYRTVYGLLIADRQIMALHGMPEGKGGAEAPARIAQRAVERFVHLYRPRPAPP